MKVLVTGAAGFIGSHLVERLLKEGFFVFGVDNFDILYDAEIKIKNLLNFVNNDNFAFSSLDIREFNALEEVFKKYDFDVVIHLAARAGVRRSIQEPEIYEDINVRGTLNILDLSKKYKIKNFIFASSSSVYGNESSVPFKEDFSADKPISPYAATKRTGELLCYTYNNLYKLPVTCLRFFTVYGPRQRPTMAIYKFVNMIKDGKTIELFGDGTSSRDYTYVSDIVDGIVLSVKKVFDYEIINLGSGNPISLTELIEIIEKVMGKKANIKKIPMQEGDVNTTFADISKAKKLLGYKPKVTIEEGIKKFVNWKL